MKKETHPKYQKTMFVDSSTGRKYFINTTLQCDKTQVYEGVEYPVCHISISSSSHPFFVGGKQFVDTEGRVDKFQNKYKAAQQKAVVQKNETAAEALKAQKAKAKSPKGSKK